MPEVQEVKFKAVGKYDGHTVKPNGAIDLRLKFSYDELLNYYVKLPLLRSVDTKLFAKVKGQEPVKLGTFMLKSYTMDHDGEGKISFNSQFDYVEMDNINALVADKDALICFLFKAVVELENEE